MRSLATLALAASLTSCVYRADIPPTPARRDPSRLSAQTPEKEPARSSRVGLRFYFKEPVPDGWTVAGVAGGSLEPAVTPLCMMRNEATGSRVLFLLKSYVDPSADPKAYHERILADSEGWLATTPPEFATAAPLGGEPATGYVGVGAFEGAPSRWLIVAGRWRETDKDPAMKVMQDAVTRLMMTSTDSATGMRVAGNQRQFCGDYY